MKLYGKEGLKKRLDSIAAKDRLPHALMFSGRAGVGKKTLARYTAQLFMCENANDGGACGSCAVCRNIENDRHPDVIFAKAKCGGKYGIEDFRALLADTVIMPNNGGAKVYIFEECDSMRREAFNALLKLVEEPADYLRFVFTCESTGLIPETVLSRVTEFEVPDTTVKDCEQCLVDGGTPAARAKELSEMFAGNIGKCRAVLEGGDEARLIETARKAAAAVGHRDKFGFAAALAETGVRAEYSQVVEYISRIFRDALSLKCGGEAEFFGKRESRKIAEAFSETEILAMLDAAFEITKNEIYNLNLALSSAYFTSRAFGHT